MSDDRGLTDLKDEIRALRVELERLNAHRFVRVQNSMRRMLTASLLRGLAAGLGTVIGATVLVSLLAFALAQIDFIPIIGEWAQDFARQIEAEISGNQGSPAPDAGAPPEDPE